MYFGIFFSSVVHGTACVWLHSAMYKTMMGMCICLRQHRPRPQGTTQRRIGLHSQGLKLRGGAVQSSVYDETFCSWEGPWMAHDVPVASFVLAGMKGV